jgi:hypothetical protein
MRALFMLAMVLGVGATACSTPFPCTRYCWSHKQDVPDVTDKDMTGVPDGRFDASCERFSDGLDWYPALPQFGWYSAEQCLAADVHQSITETVASIQDPMVDASGACDVTDLQVYADLVETLAMQARDACVAHLSCNGAPAGCDMDPIDEGIQACTISGAETLCDHVVLGPAFAALGDLSNGPDAAQPQPDGTVIEYVDDPLECEPLVNDTDSPLCADGAGGGVGESSSGGGDGVDGSSSGGDGVDGSSSGGGDGVGESGSSEGGGAGPFGGIKSRSGA